MLKEGHPSHQLTVNLNCSQNAWYCATDHRTTNHGSSTTDMDQPSSRNSDLRSVFYSEAPNNSCPAFVELSESQFAPVDEETEDFEKHAHGESFDPFLLVGQDFVGAEQILIYVSTGQTSCLL